MTVDFSPLIDLKDPSFRDELFTQCKLYVQFSFDRLKFLYYYIPDNKFLAYQEYEIKSKTRESGSDIEEYLSYVKFILEKNTLISRHFEEIIVIVENRSSSLIPIAVYSQGHDTDYLQFNQKIEEPFKVFNNKLINLGSYNIFSIPEGLYDIIREIFPSAFIVHHSSSLIENFFLQNKHSPDKETVFLNVRNGFEDIIVFSGSTMKFCNNFEYSTKEDFIYFLLFVTEQLNLNPETFKLKLSGTIDQTSELFEILENYVRHIGFVDRNPQFRYSYIFDNMPDHYNYNLFNTGKCE